MAGLLTQAHALEGIVDGSAAQGSATQATGQSHVVARGPGGDEVVVLEDEADVPGPEAGRSAGAKRTRLGAEELNGPGCGGIKSGDALQKSGLAAAGGSDQSGEAADGQGEVDTVERGDVGVAATLDAEDAGDSSYLDGQRYLRPMIVGADCGGTTLTTDHDSLQTPATARTSQVRTDTARIPARVPSPHRAAGRLSQGPAMISSATRTEGSQVHTSAPFILDSGSCTQIVTTPSTSVRASPRNQAGTGGRKPATPTAQGRDRDERNGSRLMPTSSLITGRRRTGAHSRLRVGLPPPHPRSSAHHLGGASTTPGAHMRQVLGSQHECTPGSGPLASSA